MGYVAPLVYNQALQYQERLRNPVSNRSTSKVNALAKRSRYERQYNPYYDPSPFADLYVHGNRKVLSHHFGRTIDERV